MKHLPYRHLSHRRTNLHLTNRHSRPHDCDVIALMDGQECVVSIVFIIAVTGNSKRQPIPRRKSMNCVEAEKQDSYYIM
ncbi:hypothetical protein [Parabacteroides gordonii]|uniref:hypothetical protein n=1 Tax=Parabacteroides gordonii TaxID=574930 RepID=UPI00241C1BE1|nr:hypothetical protein [Parabacteroides gordonii]